MTTSAKGPGPPEVSGLSRREAGALDPPPRPRFLFQGGSVLSPAAVISQERARQQAVALAEEVGCPTSSVQEMVSCLRWKPADVLNDAQTKVGPGEQAGEGHSLTLCPWKTRPRKETAPRHPHKATQQVGHQLALGRPLPAPCAVHRPSVQ